MRQYMSYEEYCRRRGKTGDDSFEIDPDAIPPLEDALEEVPNNKASEDVVVERASLEEPVTELPRREKKEERRARRQQARAEQGAGIWSVLFLLICFGVAVACAILMAQAFEKGRVDGGTKVTLPGYTVYCVQTAAPTTTEDAAQSAQDAKTKGGGGYIYVSDGLYVVLASAYESEADCDSVIEKLALSKITASKFVIEIPSKSIALVSEEVRNTVSNGYHAIWTTYKELYALSNSIDTEEVSPAAARLAIGKIRKRLTDSVSACQEIKTPETASIYLKAALVSMAGQLESLYVDVDHDATLSRDIKYAYLKILHDFTSLNKEIG